MSKYKCIGCSQIHNDNDYSKEDGDILIEEDYINWQNMRLKKEGNKINISFEIITNDVKTETNGK